MENIVTNIQSVQEGAEIDLKKIVKAILKHAWKIGIIAVLCGSIALFVSYQFLTPMYKTTTSFYVNNKLPLNGVNTNITSNDILTSSSLVNSYIAILNNRDILSEVISHSQLNLSSGQLSGMISTSVVKETGVFKVTVSSTDPAQAAAVAESIAHIMTTRICEIIEGSSIRVIDYPIVPTTPYSPNHTKNAALGLFAGLLLSVGFVVLLEIIDTKIKSEDELKRYCKYPVLTVVPDMNQASNKNNKYYRSNYGYYAQNSSDNTNTNGKIATFGKNIDFASTEAYKLLRTKLQYSLTDSNKCQVFVVSSAMAGEGKSLSSINLAYSLAHLNKKVLLIDADMRRPSLANKLSIPNYPGLSELLTGFLDLGELLQDYSDDGQHVVKVLAAGSIPPNPVELIDSSRMTQAFDVLRKEFDYIIVDTPPVGDVSDALVASKFADGVLLVVRHNYCKHTVLRNTVHHFEFVNAKILGTIYNGLADGPNIYGKYKYYSPYKYTSINNDSKS